VGIPSPAVIKYISKKNTKMKNQQLESLISELKKTAIQNDAAVWKKVAMDLEGPTSMRPAVNLSKIDKYARDGETILVPGKILSMGTLSKKITVAAYNFSHTAVEKIKASGSDAISIDELARKNPKGQKVRILG
jgi:large subunit ribosomal protein L18e